MEIHSLYRPLFVTACAALLATEVPAAESPRERLSLDAGWKFHLGDKWPDALRLDKAGMISGPAPEKLFSDVTWRTANLPHDWGVEVPFDQAADLGHGFRKLESGFEKTSIGWYRRTFDLPAADVESTFDIKKHLRPGDNVIAVCVKDGSGRGGMNPATTVEIIGKPESAAWSRSLFNGRAQLIVQASRKADVFNLSDNTHRLTLSAAVVKTPTGAQRPLIS